MTALLISSTSFASGTVKEYGVDSAEKIVHKVGKGILKNNETGEEIELPVKVETREVTSNSLINTLLLEDRKNYVTTYFIEIPESIFKGSSKKKGKDKNNNSGTTNENTLQAMGSGQASKEDPSISWRAWIQQYWSEYQTSDGQRAVAIQKYNVKWERLDSQVGGKDAYILAGCLANTEPYTGLCNKQEKKIIGVPTINYWYEMKPSWAGTYHIVNGYAYLSGQGVITLYRGGSSWNLRIIACLGGSRTLGGCDLSQ